MSRAVSGTPPATSLIKDTPKRENPSGAINNAIDQLYQQHRQVLLNHLQSMVKDRHIAEELLHDVFVRVSGMPALDVIQKPRPFLLKVANNLALDYLRSQQKYADNHTGTIGEEGVPEAPDNSASHVDVLLREQQISDLKSAIRQLPDRTREALLLAKFREMPLKAVAKEMDISQTMVEKHLKNAIEKCRTALKRKQH